MSRSSEGSRIVLVDEDEFNIDAVREVWRGRSLGRSLGRYPVEHDPIRRYCHMTGERTPVFLDVDAAACSPWGRVVCPPMFVRYFVGNGPWPPPEVPDPSPIPMAVPRLGDRGINLETSWEFRRPVLVGDRLHAEWTVDDVFVKATRLDPKSVWIVTSSTVLDEDDEVVAVARNTVLYHRPAPDGGGGPKDRGPVVPDGSTPAFTMDLTATKATLQVSGSQDWNLVHHDQEYARSSGHESVFFNTGWTQGLLGRIVAEYIDERPWRLTALSFRMTRMNRPGDRVTAWYRLVESSPEEVALDIGLSNDRLGVTTTGSATILCGPGPEVIR